MRYTFLLFLCLLYGCTKTIVAPIEFDENLLDTLVVTATPLESDLEINETPKVYHPSATHSVDLLHTKLEVSFNWDRQQVLGKAELDLTPYFYPINTLVLDAKKMDIHAIKIDNKLIKSFSYDSTLLNIELPKTYTKKEQIKVNIEYTANPNAPVLDGPNASDADKGLFFINHDGSSDKPQQIWTQGETENNSRWFPTIDRPNERCSQEIFVRVDSRFKTLSNGRLVSSTNNPDGTRTDYWKQDAPHAPYLFMLAVGEYAVLEDKWQDVPLLYYVEPFYEDYAKEVYNHTPEMLAFFSNVWDYKYPWDKYAQVTVKDFVAGAMENTGAVIFGDFVQKDGRELADYPNDNIVAHELVHHWFGNLVTCESWANLTMNEGFANYGEYLWQEHKYGRDAADDHKLSEFHSYIYSTQFSGTHPLIHFSYHDKEDMFDAHSYNKGGMILHMLRNLVGDEAFFTSLSHYLKSNEYQSVEAHNLRLAFEKTTGLDLNWFFNQWYFGTGHPTIHVNYEYSTDTTFIDVEQTQSLPDAENLFIIPFNAKVFYEDGSEETGLLTMSKRKQRFSIPTRGKKVDLAILDSQADILASFVEPRTQEEYYQTLNRSDEYLHKRIALESITTLDQTMLNKMMNENHHFFRVKTLEKFGDQLTVEQLVKTANSDNSSRVTIEALNQLYEQDAGKCLAIIQNLLDQKGSYDVYAHCLDLWYDLEPEATLAYLDQQSYSYVKPFRNTLGSIYANSEEEKYLAFFEANAQLAIDDRDFGLIDNHIYLINLASDDGLIRSIDFYFDLFNVARTENLSKSCQNVCLHLINLFEERLLFKNDLDKSIEKINGIKESLIK